MLRWPDKTPVGDDSSRVREDSTDVPLLDPPFESVLALSAALNPSLMMHIYERLTVLCEWPVVAHPELARAMEQPHVGCQLWWGCACFYTKQ